MSSEQRESLHTQTQPLFDGDDCRSVWLMQPASAPTGQARTGAEEGDIVVITREAPYSDTLRLKKP